MMRHGPIFLLWTMLSSRHGTTCVSLYTLYKDQRLCFDLRPVYDQVLTNIPPDDPEIRTSDPESQWVNYFAFLGRLVAAEVTPDWFEIPATTLKEVLLEDVEPSALTEYKTRALAEYLNQAGEGFMDWCIDSGMLDANKSMDIVAPLLKSPVRQDWFGGRGAEDKAVQESQTRGRKRSEA